MKAKIKTIVKAVSLIIVAWAFLRYSGAPAESSGFSIPVPSAPGVAVSSNRKAVIDYSNAKYGYVMARYVPRTTKRLKAIVKGPTGVSYTYDMRAGNFEVFPLSEGNGTYTVGVYEQVEGTRYAVANTATIRVTLVNEFVPFLTPNQHVNFNKNSETVKRAAELAGGSPGVIGQISAVYNYIVDNFSYDRELARTVQSGYLPDVDVVLRKRQGICFDFAAVMTAMLRSLGIPCRMVVGYAGSIYHAWIDAYSDETGWINQVIFFDGKSWRLMDPTFAASATQGGDIARFVGDGSNYRPRFRY